MDAVLPMLAAALFQASPAAVADGLWCVPPEPEPWADTAPVSQAPVAPTLYSHGSRQIPTVALTFDACSTRSRDPYDPRIARVLAATGTPATFFVGGLWAREEPEALLELSRLPGVELGNHTWSHPHLPHTSDAEIAREIGRTQAEIYARTGRLPTLLRPPFGDVDDHAVRAVARLGLTTVEYDVASGDPDARFTKERLVASVLARVRPGSIVVMHVNHPSFHTAEALPEIIAGLRARGFGLVTVGELIRQDGALELAEAERASCPAPVAEPKQPFAQGGELSPAPGSPPRPATQPLLLSSSDGALLADDSGDRRRRRARAA
ncbi:MAG TPA: polysaccharide deacetylase family protein [Myxococcales bacterium]|jgi:peptidoglycan/xylan/chitin deacetylase (PgdA/CDA1 family)